MVLYSCGARRAHTDTHAHTCIRYDLATHQVSHAASGDRPDCPEMPSLPNLPALPVPDAFPEQVPSLATPFAPPPQPSPATPLAVVKQPVQSGSVMVAASPVKSSAPVAARSARRFRLPPQAYQVSQKNGVSSPTSKQLCDLVARARCLAIIAHWHSTTCTTSSQRPALHNCGACSWRL